MCSLLGWWAGAESWHFLEIEKLVLMGVRQCRSINVCFWGISCEVMVSRGSDS